MKVFCFDLLNMGRSEVEGNRARGTMAKAGNKYEMTSALFVRNVIHHISDDNSDTSSASIKTSMYSIPILYGEDSRTRLRIPATTLENDFTWVLIYGLTDL